jgi:glycosyltransferase 2 family protein
MKKRRWLLWAGLLGLGVLVFAHFTSLRSLIAQIGNARWEWVLVAALLHILYFGLYAVMYQEGFRVVEVESQVGALVPLVFAAIFANAVLPSGGAAAAALFVDDAERRGQSGARAAVGVVLVLLADLASLLPFLGYGLAALALRRDLRFYDLAGGAIFVAYVACLSSILLLAAWKPDWLRVLFGWVRRTINRVGSRFKRPNLLPEDWDRRTADDFAGAATAITHHPRELALTLCCGLAGKVLSLSSLYAIFLAFRQPIPLGSLVAGFSIGVVFWVITFIPHGVAAMEGMMLLVFTSLGIPGPRAAAITLVFRGVNYWLPLVLGFIFLRYIRAFDIDQSLGDAAPKERAPEGRLRR